MIIQSKLAAFHIFQTFVEILKFCVKLIAAKLELTLTGDIIENGGSLD